MRYGKLTNENLVDLPVMMGLLTSDISCLIEDCAKDGGEELFAKIYQYLNL